MKKLFFGIFTILFLAVIFTTSIEANNYYISPTGKDDNDGLSEQSPWASYGL
jgi:hypothetical protein